jgi:hypothetical protein
MPARRATLKQFEPDSQTLHKNLIHTKAMKKSMQRPVGIVGAFTCASLLMLQPAYADSTPSPVPSPSSSPTSSPIRTPLEQYKYDRDNYIAAVKARDVAIRLINQNFNGAMKKLELDYRLAMQLAKNPDQKFQANNARKLAISSAINARDIAIVLLGAAPTPPVEPMKAAKSRMTKEKKR